jgi:hypothetical protein
MTSTANVLDDDIFVDDRLLYQSGILFFLFFINVLISKTIK